jgi:hypothetical protein
MLMGSLLFEKLFLEVITITFTALIAIELLNVYSLVKKPDIYLKPITSPITSYLLKPPFLHLAPYRSQNHDNFPVPHFRCLPDQYSVSKGVHRYCDNRWHVLLKGSINSCCVLAACSLRENAATLL